MQKPDIKLATNEEREWAANLLFGSDPWITLGISLERCRINCNDPEFQLYIAHIEGKPCGAIILDKRGVAGSPYIKSIVISKEYRGFGLGADLIKFTEELFHNEAKHLFLCVSSFNKRARSFYERIGFKVVGELKDYIIEGQSEILLHKRI